MKKQLTANQQIIEKDIMRYKNNSLASNLALLSLVFECLYFIVMYGQVCGNREGVYANGDLVYGMLMGVSVILNLFILLGVFYASVQLKNYNKTYSYVVWVIAVVQIVRIFVYPLQTYNTTLVETGARLFGTSTFVLMIVYLVLSAVCLVLSGIVGIIRATRLEKFRKDIAENKVDLEAAYKEEDVAEEVTANA